MVTIKWWNYFWSLKISEWKMHYSMQSNWGIIRLSECFWINKSKSSFFFCFTIAQYVVFFDILYLTNASSFFLVGKALGKVEKVTNIPVHRFHRTWHLWSSLRSIGISNLLNCCYQEAMSLNFPTLWIVSIFSFSQFTFILYSKISIA